MLHMLLIPMAWAAHAGQWIDRHVLSPFAIGETAKQVVEEEFGCYGVLAYLIYKTSRLTVEAWPLYQPAWLVSRIARLLGLATILIVSAWLLTCLYIGLLIPVVALDVSRLGLLLSPVVGWLVLGYVMLSEHVRERRTELEAEGRKED